MNDVDIARGLLFKLLKVSTDTFEERIIYQKKIYMLQSAGLNLGYDYSWYLKGPYSPRLTTYIYDNLDVLSSLDFTTYNLKEDVAERVSKINNFDKSKPPNLRNDEWYELLASLLFLHNNSASWKLQNEEDCIQKLTELKPHYSRENCEFAFKSLSDSEMFKMEGNIGQ